MQLEFKLISFQVEPTVVSNIFACKTNKTLAQTIQHKRYKSLAPHAKNYTNGELFLPIGTFMLKLKDRNDPFYKEFLNDCGDLEYCQFRVTAKNWLERKGLYIYMIGNQIMYVGRCRDSFRKRINSGYGHISPKNCFKDGQKTNCHLNNLIHRNRKRVQLLGSELSDEKQIIEWERCIIEGYNPPWNIALRK